MKRRPERAVRVAIDQSRADDHLVEPGPEHPAADDMDLIVDLKRYRQNAAEDHVVAPAALPLEQGLYRQFRRGHRIARRVVPNLGQEFHGVELVEAHRRVGFGGRAAAQHDQIVGRAGIADGGAESGYHRHNDHEHRDH